MEGEQQKDMAVEKYAEMERLYNEIMGVDERIAKDQAKVSEMRKTLTEQADSFARHFTDIGRVASGEYTGRTRPAEAEEEKEEEVEDAGR